MAELLGESEQGAIAGVTGTGLKGVEGKGGPGGIGVLGTRVGDGVAGGFAGFVAVKGDAGSGTPVVNGIPQGLPLIGVLGVVSTPLGAAIQGVNDQGNAGEFKGRVVVDGQLL